MQNLCVLEQTDILQFQPLEKSNQHRDALQRLRRMKAQQRKEVRDFDPKGLTLLEKVRIVNSRASSVARQRWFVEPMSGAKLLEVDKHLTVVKQEPIFENTGWSDFSVDVSADCIENSPWGDVSGEQNLDQIDASVDGATIAGLLFADQNPSWSAFESVLSQLDFGTGSLGSI